MPGTTQVVRSRVVCGRVSSNRQLASRLYALCIDVALQPFQAGQFVRLQLEIDGETVAKPYSLVNAPGEPLAEVFFNTVPGGRLSNALAALRAGDPVGVSQPATGFFVLEETPKARDLWMFATGTGLGPYLSMLRTATVWERFEKVVLVHGVPLREELVYQELIAAAASQHSGRFHFVSCVSREENPSGVQGRLTHALENGSLETLTGLELSPADSSVMLCGNHGMINEMQELLAGRGLRKHLRHKPGHIVTEQYF